MSSVMSSVVPSVMSSKSFVSEITISEKLLDLMREVSRDLAMRAVIECGTLYNFSGDEAVRTLGLCEVKVSTSKGKSSRVVMSREKKVKKSKASFPLPFLGVLDESCCRGLKSNHGLYTQCSSKVEEGLCKSCELQASKNADGKPDSGRVEDRVAVGLYEYKDSKGKSPIAYTKIMKKLNLSKDEIVAEADRLGVKIPEEHFEVCVSEGKRGRPKSDKVDKELKGAKGRPKKTKKVMELDGDDDDLFSALVAKANEESMSVVDDVPNVEEAPAVNEEANKASKEAAKAADKAAKDAAKEAAKAADKAAKEAAKEAAKAADKAAKEAAKEAAKAADKAAKEEAKAAAKAADKAAKEEAKAAAKEAAKSSKKPKSVAKSAVEAESAVESVVESAVVAKPSEAVEPKPVAKVVDENVADVVKKFTYEGKMYLKSKNTGVIYNMEQDAVGRWNAETNKIDFMEEEEECESEYEE